MRPQHSPPVVRPVPSTPPHLRGATGRGLPFPAAGEHRHGVQVRAGQSRRSPRGAVLAVAVQPPFVDTPGFLLVLLLAVALATAVAVLLRVRVTRRREERLERLVAERTQELERTRVHLERANRRLTRLASLDSLTGVANRRALMDRLQAEWRRALRGQRLLGLLMIDLDHFKPYNDLHGHPAGDECLQRVVGLLQLRLRRADELLARYGGDELAAVVPEIPSAGELETLAEDLRRQVERERIIHGASGIAPWVTVTVGGAVLVPTLESDPHRFLELADAALYAAKEAGRNRAVVFDSTSAVESGKAMAETV